MADRKISDLTALTAPAAGDYLPIVDISEVAAASKNKRITIEELFRGVPLGTAAAPSIAIEGDENTGIYSPGADQLAISTGGTGRLFVDASGRVGIGTTSPSHLLTVSGTATVAKFISSGGDVSLAFQNSTSNAGYIQYTADNLTFWTNNTERARITSAGLLGLGTSAPRVRLHVQGGDVTLDATTGTSAATLDVVSDVSTNEGQNAAPGIAFRAPYAAALPDRITYAAIWSKKETAGTGNQQGALVFGTNVASGTGVTEKVRITSAGRLGIGTSAPLSQLNVDGTATGAPTTTSKGTCLLGSSTNVGLAFGFYDGTSSNFNAYIQSIEKRSGFSTTYDIAMQPIGGRLLVGTSTSQSIPFPNTTVQSRQLQIEGSNYVGIGIVSNANAANGTRPATLTLSRTGSDSNNTTAVINSDDLGAVNFTGHDGTGHKQAGSIICQVDGTPGTNDMPGRLVFSTTADGAASPTERMRITSAGYVAIGTSSATELLNVNGHSFTGTAEYYTANRTRTSGVTWYKKRGVARPSAGQKGRATITFSESSGSPNAFHKVRVTQSGSLTAAFYEFLVAEAGGTFSIVNDNTAYNKAQFAITMSSPTLTIDTAVVGADWGSMTVEIETFEMGNNDVTLAMSVV